MNRNLRPVYWLTCVLILLTSSLYATTIVMPTDEQLVAKAPVIVRGIVLSSQAIEESGSIYTDTVVAVESAIKGTPSWSITIREIGGIVGDRITKIYGTPEFKVGERVLVFVSPDGRGHFRTVDLFAGKFGEQRATNGRYLLIRGDDDPHVQLLGNDLQPAPISTVDRDADRFVTFVFDRASGREGVRDYFVTKAALPKLRAEANFSLISEPTVYRWFAFDSGTSASWTSHGTQGGYTGGGESELKSAMSSWTSYAGANIRYSYAGASVSTPGGLSHANGRNEIMFDDPLNEIDGAFNPSTGGVVGTGGFNGVSNSSNWTAPFDADATHTARTYRAWNVTEGNLTIQDGVTSNRFSSSRLAEIISHELGHTLGFGHSADGTALMYANVTGLGPSLREDDRIAARWLYSSGGTTPTPNPTPTRPAAPSNLTGSASGSTVNLQWNDNATDESGHSVYVSNGGGWTKEADLGAGVRTATLQGFAAGSYSFYVVAFNAAGTSTSSNIIAVMVAAAPSLPPLVAAFTWAPSTTMVGEPVSFNDQSTGGVTARLWSFGDGTSSSQPTPVKRYAAAGTYSVTLTVYRGSESRVASQAITIGQSSPIIPAPVISTKRRIARR